MATPNQIAANRLNAKKSTGPRSNQGKFRSRQNAMRHGLSAETVITSLESMREYETFERTIVSGYRPTNTLERMLTARLASLLWRLRRSLVIETGLFQAQGQMIKARRTKKPSAETDNHSLVPSSDEYYAHDPLRPDVQEQRVGSDGCVCSITISECFFRLSTDHGDLLERVDRYGASLWRQAAQTMLLLEACKKQRAPPGQSKSGK